jgi:hypothetical protein
MNPTTAKSPVLVMGAACVFLILLFGANFFRASAASPGGTNQPACNALKTTVFSEKNVKIAGNHLTIPPKGFVFCAITNLPMAGRTAV